MGLVIGYAMLTKEIIENKENNVEQVIKDLEKVIEVQYKVITEVNNGKIELEQLLSNVKSDLSIPLEHGGVFRIVVKINKDKYGYFSCDLNISLEYSKEEEKHIPIVLRYNLTTLLLDLTTLEIITEYLKEHQLNLIAKEHLYSLKTFDKQTIEKYIKDKMLEQIIDNYGLSHNEGLLEFEVVDIPQSNEFMKFNTYINKCEDKVLIYSGRRKFKKEYQRVLDKYEYIQNKEELAEILYNFDFEYLALDNKNEGFEGKYHKAFIKKFAKYIETTLENKFTELNHIFVKPELNELDEWYVLQNSSTEEKKKYIDLTLIDNPISNNINIKADAYDSPLARFDLSHVYLYFEEHIINESNRFDKIMSVNIKNLYPDLFENISDLFEDIDTLFERLNTDIIDWFVYDTLNQDKYNFFNDIKFILKSVPNTHLDK